MALSKEHQKLALQIAHDAAHAAGIQAADAATHQGLDNEDALAAGYKAYRQRFDLVAEVMEAWWNEK